MTLGTFRFFATLDLDAAAARRRHAAAARHPEVRAACVAAARDRLRDARHWRLRRIAALAAEAAAAPPPARVGGALPVLDVDWSVTWWDEIEAALASGWTPEPDHRAP